MGIRGYLRARRQQKARKRYKREKAQQDAAERRMSGHPNPKADLARMLGSGPGSGTDVGRDGGDG